MVHWARQGSIVTHPEEAKSDLFWWPLWWPTLTVCFGGLFWGPVLVAYFGGLFWRPVLVACGGGLFWWPVLAALLRYERHPQPAL